MGNHSCLITLAQVCSKTDCGGGWGFCRSSLPLHIKTPLLLDDLEWSHSHLLCSQTHSLPHLWRSASGGCSELSWAESPWFIWFTSSRERSPAAPSEPAIPCWLLLQPSIPPLVPPKDRPASCRWLESTPTINPI